MFEYSRLQEKRARIVIEQKTHQSPDSNGSIELNGYEYDILSRYRINERKQQYTTDRITSEEIHNMKDVLL